MGFEIIKCDPDEDLYMEWSHYTGAPTFIGDQEALFHHLTSSVCHNSASTPLRRIDRAAKDGTSALDGRGCYWQTGGLRYRDRGWLSRDKFVRFARRFVVQDDGGIDSMLEAQVFFADSSSAMTSSDPRTRIGRQAAYALAVCGVDTVSYGTIKAMLPPRGHLLARKIRQYESCRWLDFERSADDPKITILNRTALRMWATEDLTEDGWADRWVNIETAIAYLRQQVDMPPPTATAAAVEQRRLELVAIQQLMSGPGNLQPARHGVRLVPTTRVI